MIIENFELENFEQRIMDQLKLLSEQIDFLIQNQQKGPSIIDKSNPSITLLEFVILCIKQKEGCTLGDIIKEFNVDLKEAKRMTYDFVKRNPKFILNSDRTTIVFNPD